MQLLSTFLFEKINLIILSIGSIIATIASTKLDKKVTRVMFVIIGLNLILSICYFVDNYLSTLPYEVYSKLEINIDILRETLSVISYTLLPSLVLSLCYILDFKLKYFNLLWILVGICFIIYSTCFFNPNISFCIKDNIYYSSNIFITRYFCHIISLIFLSLFIFEAFLSFKDASVIENILLIFITVAATISGIADTLNTNSSFETTIPICIILFYVYLHLQYIRKNDTKNIKLSKVDTLTALGNEKAYFEFISFLETPPKKTKKITNYEVLMIDLNQLKSTNDKYGHRYGCQLVIECGHKLKQIFLNSDAFHIGGDEFVVVISGDDYLRKEELIQQTIDTIEYTTITFEKQELVLSAAIGSATHKKGMSFNDTLQEADNAMYRKKLELKQKYNFDIR